MAERSARTGAVGFAAVSAVAAALLWALADQSAAGAISADLAANLWAVDRTLWRFATWRLTVPLIVVGLVLHRYSTLGQFGAVTSVMVYNEEGQLIDRGTTEGADAIKSLMLDDWKFPAGMSDLDPNDPLTLA